VVEPMKFLAPDSGAGPGGVTGPGPGGESAATPAVPSTSGNGLETSHEASLVGQAPATSWIDSSGTFAEGWTQKLPEEFAGTRESLSKFKTFPDLVRAYDSANKLVGRKGVIMPTPESSSEEVSAFRKALGVPETADGYAAATKPPELPEGVQWNDEIAKSYFEVAHRHNVSTEAMKELIGLNMKQREFELQAHRESIEETKHKGLAHLRSQWGSDFDRNIAVAQRAAALGGVDTNSYGWRDPEVVKLVVRMANMMGEDKFVGAGTSLPAGTADIRQRAMDIMRNPANPLHQRYRDGDVDVQAQVRQMLKQSTK
jgi:uncharacterized protein YdbL (DUF1318 family)